MFDLNAILSVRPVFWQAFGEEEEQEEEEQEEQEKEERDKKKTKKKKTKKKKKKKKKKTILEGTAKWYDRI